MFGILDRYIGRVIFMSILLCELTLVGLAALIKYVEQLKAVGEGNYDMLNALYFVLLSMPKEAVLFFPLAALLGGLIGLGQLATSSELVVMQASGRSKISIVMAALKTAIPLMLLVGLMGEYVAPAAKRMADDIKAGAMSSGVCQDCLDRTHLKFVLLEACHDRLDAERLCNPHACVNRRICYPRESCNTHDPEI